MTLDELVAPIAKQLGLDAGVVQAVCDLLESGATVAYAARYERDATGGLDEPRLLAVRDLVRKKRLLGDRKASVLRSLEGQSKLGDELRTAIQRADSLARLDDLYLPHKPRQSSSASEAIGQGLAPLAEEVLAESPSVADLDARSADFVNEDKKVNSVAEAIAGAGKILAERFSLDPELRRRVRSIVRKTGKLVSKRTATATDKKAEAYKAFLDYREAVSKAPPHRVLAINRGERAKVLDVSIEADADAAVKAARELLAPPTHPHVELLNGCAEEAVRNLLLPELGDETRRELTERAETHAMEVFARNLRNLLMGPRLPGRRVLAIDPGYQNGCHLAVIDEQGAVLATGKVSIMGEGDALAATRQTLVEMLKTHGATLIAIGNGKACRPAEELVASLIAEELSSDKELGSDEELKGQAIEYLIVSEAGANVYASSTVGREELPDLDAGHRGAVSIGRRVQDPLAELVKVDPASVGVGLYQHDAKSKAVRDALEEVVQSCVASVGVDVNTAAASLLRYVPGLNALTARRIAAHREEKGPFASREALREVPGVTEAAFTQAAGFVRIPGAANPLDRAWVHPKQYPAAEKLLSAAGLDLTAYAADDGPKRFREAIADRDRNQLAEQAGLGPLGVAALIEALAEPGVDPRDKLPPPTFRRGVVRFEDLAAGTELEGSVLNVVDFGAFVDIGLSDSGLLHISRMSHGFVSDPHAIVSVGDRVRVWVDSVDSAKRRVSLSLIEPGTEPPKEAAPPRRRGGGKKPHGDQPQSQKPSSAAHGGSKPRRSKPKQARGGKPGGGKRGGGRAPRPTTYEARAKGPPKPITQEMQEGKEAMRTFGDLLQFHKKKSKEDGDETNP